MTFTSRVIRMISNTPSFVNAMYNPFWFGDTCPDITRKKFSELMNPLGEMHEITEQNLKAYVFVTDIGWYTSGSSWLR
jgi:pyrroline-5-carboxylate reductase